jgi:hypothetical protein
MKLLVYTSLTACLLLSGCGKSEDPAATASPAVTPAASTTPTPTPADSATPTASPSPAGEVTPADLYGAPFYPGSTPFEGRGSHKSDDPAMKQASSGRLTSDSLDKIVAFYKDALPKVGIKIDTVHTNPAVTTIMAGTSKRGEMLTVEISKDPDGSSKTMVEVTATTNK